MASPNSICTAHKSQHIAMLLSLLLLLVCDRERTPYNSFGCSKLDTKHLLFANKISKQNSNGRTCRDVLQLKLNIHTQIKAEKGTCWQTYGLASRHSTTRHIRKKVANREKNISGIRNKNNWICLFQFTVKHNVPFSEHNFTSIKVQFNNFIQYVFSLSLCVSVRSVDCCCCCFIVVCASLRFAL